jgi:hypothetical protein
MTGMLKLMTAAEGLGMMMNCVALPWASLELFADAALELESLESLLLVLSGGPEPRAASSAVNMAHGRYHYQS